MKIILIRHGETKPNVVRTYSGWNNVSLNKKGKAQAKKVGKHLSDEKIDMIYSSDLKRAREFAKIAFKRSPIKASADLREINFGAFEGLTHEEIMNSYPEQYRAWLISPEKIAIPKGESLCDLKKRVFNFFSRIKKADKYMTIAIVSHAGPIRSIIAHLNRSKNFWKIDIDNASITVLEHKNGKMLIKKINDTSFL